MRSVGNSSTSKDGLRMPDPEKFHAISLLLTFTNLSVNAVCLGNQEENSKELWFPEDQH